MADIIRNASIYVKGKKCAEAQTGTLTLETNAEQHPADGIILISQGMPTCALKFDALVPFGGAPVDTILLDAYESGDAVQVRWGVDGGRIMQFDATLKTNTRTADMAKGQQKADYDFMGPKPKMVSL